MVEMPWMKKQKIASVQNEDVQHLGWKVLHRQGLILLGLGVGSLKGIYSPRHWNFLVFFKRTFMNLISLLIFLL